MSGWVSSWLRGNEEKTDEETKFTEVDHTPAIVPDADELRRKRMERLAQLEQVQPVEDKPTDIKTTTPIVANVPIVQPKTPSITESPSNPSVMINSTEKSKPKTTGNVPRSYINEMLQRILQLTLSPVVAASNEKYLYLQEFATQTEETELKTNHVSEVLYSRIIINPVHLSGTPQPVSVLQYLEQCYYRCRDEIQALQSTYLRLPESEKQDAEACVVTLREMCINYSVTTLTEPEMYPFEVGTLNTEALDKIVRTQGHALTPEFIEKLAIELETNGQAFPIFAPIFQKILSELFMMHPPSLMSGFYNHMHWITMLCRIKVLANVLTNMPGFLLVSGAPFTGRRLQDATALGLLLRFSTHQDPAIQQMFTNITKRTKNDVDNSITAIRNKLSTVQNGCTEIFKLLLKAGGKTRELTLEWMEQALATNVELAKEHPDQTITSTNGMMLNLAVVLLHLCSPFMSPDSSKSHLINNDFVSIQNQVFPKDVTLLLGNREGQEHDGRRIKSMSDFNFITRCYFMTARAIHLGPVAQIGQYMRLLRQISYIQSRMNDENADPRLRAHFDALATAKLTMDAELLHPDGIHELIRFVLLSCTVVNTVCSNAANQGTTVTTLPFTDPAAAHIIHWFPEHVIEDICSVLIFVARLQPKELQSFALDELLQMILIFLSSPSYIRSPHLRAKMSEVLFYLFLPSEETVGTTSGIHLLHTNVLAQQHLAPCLLALYGDVELTGFYEKLEHRYHIACLLNYLWNLHKSAFIKISKDEENFKKFAHGLLNHINGLVTDALISLPEIKSLQEEMQDVSTWMALDETVREQKQSLLADKERTVTSSLQLANETIHMMAYLTSEIQEPFLQSTDLEERLASMLSSVLVKLAGPRGIELKVQNPEQYKFRPKEMLHEIVETLLHFASYPSFQQAMASNGYYDPIVFQKCTVILRRTRLLSEPDIAKFDQFVLDVEQKAKEVVDLEEILGEIPEEFLDPLLCTLMKDPVFIPTSGKTMDRSTIVQHLMNDPSDPFTRAPLTIDQLKPNEELKEKIETWIKTQQKS